MGTNTRNMPARHQDQRLPTHSDMGVPHPTIETMNATLARNLASHTGTPAPAPPRRSETRSETASEPKVRLKIHMPRSEAENDPDVCASARILMQMSRDMRGWEGESEGMVSADEDDGEGRRDSAFEKGGGEKEGEKI